MIAFPDHRLFATLVFPGLETLPSALGEDVGLERPHAVVVVRQLVAYWEESRHEGPMKTVYDGGGGGLNNQS